MESGHPEISPQVCHPSDGNDAKYVSGLSTILVATIQEAKDRISQIEYIFCSQLYPNFQKNSKCLQKLYSEARRAAEEEWKERECKLELQMKELCLEKEQTLKEGKVLKAEKSKLLRRIAELEEKLLQKSKEVDDGMELHGKLLDLIETKASTITNKEMQMKEREGRMNFLLAKFEGLEETINVLNKELQEKNEVFAKEKELNQDLLRQIESQALKITSSEQTLSDTHMEKKQLVAELANIAASSDGLKDELRRKIIELEEGNKLQEQLVQQVNLNSIELTKKDQQLSAHEREKKLLLSRINDLENKLEVLDENLRERISGISKRSEYHNDLVQQIELKNAELSAERQRCNDVIAAYKKLKSQHNFLLSKVPLNKEDMLPQIKLEVESDPLSHDTPVAEITNTTPVSSVVAGDLNKVKKEINSIASSKDEKGGRPLNQSRSSPPTSRSKSPAASATHWITGRKSGSSTGTKRPASGWRDTRSRQSPGGADPHDDFLDTPYENIRGNLMHKAIKDNLHDIPAQRVPKDMDSDSLNDETQDMQAECGSKKHASSSRPGPKGFKYVEPVRKKSEREILNGIECKQCKKFYDAVLSDAVGKNGEVEKQNFRCEHHDGVSRHRYRFVPPMTPEGFWNIGFDSET